MSTVLSKNLKKFRQQKNYTQEKAAEILGVSTHTVSRWECNTTLPDVTLLPEIARLYCVTIDDLFKESSTAYKNYAQRLASVYEETRNPEDFICADQEFKRLIQKGEDSPEDLWTYGTLHHFMMQYSEKNAIALFDRVLDMGPNVDTEIYWKTKVQKMLLYSQIGKSKDNIKVALAEVQKNANDAISWRCLITAYIFADDLKNAYESFTKAAGQFPNDAIIYTLGGDVCDKMGKTEEALSYWRKAVAWDSTCLDAKYSMINYFCRIKDADQCRRLLREIVEELKNSGLDIEAEGEERRLKKLLGDLL